MKNNIIVMTAAMAAVIVASATEATRGVAQIQEDYADQPQQIIALVRDAAALISTRGEAAFDEFRTAGSRWREGETYIFVLDPKGNMVVHPDPAMEGKNQINLEDVNGKQVVRGLLATATTIPDRLEGWYHYQWPVPGGLIPRWKSSFVKQAQTPKGKKYIVGCGEYDDRMEREFVVDMVEKAIAQVQKDGESAFALLRDPTGPFLAKDAYIFVDDLNGLNLLNPGFPNLEGKNLYDQKDAKGKYPTRDMVKIVQEKGAGWVEYMWPKPGESIPTQKSTYVSIARLGGQQVMVGCGVYLADAPKAVTRIRKMTASELMSLVREAAEVFEQYGEKVFPEFRDEGTKWFHDDTYFFVWTMDGTRYFHAVNPEGEGDDMSSFTDMIGRPLGQMVLAAGSSPEGEGWVHYMYPEPGNMYCSWKSSFVKRVAFPSGKQYIIGCGIYNMEMDRAFIEDVVNRAADLVASKGEGAFVELRDKKGPFVFMDTYVFVDNLDGVELVNAAMPNVEGKNLINDRDASGKQVMKEYLDAAVKNGTAWVDYYWYRPGSNTIAKKYTYVKAVKQRGDTYVLGAGFYETDRTREYEYEETRQLVLRVDDAASLLRTRGETAFDDFRKSDSRWREDEAYIFVLDTKGNMLVHPDPALEGKNELDLKDVNGKPIIRGLLGAAMSSPDKPEGWYHYQWQVPGGLLPRWKSSFVRMVRAPSGKQYVIGCGMYNDRMERVFIVDAVQSAVKEIEKRGKEAFAGFYDLAGSYRFKDAYIWVNDLEGVELINPVFPNLEGQKLLDRTDANGTYVYREMIQMIEAQGEGWMDYMVPKPGESTPTRKSSYVHSARLGDQEVIVGCGAYLSADSRQLPTTAKMTAEELADFVNEAAKILEARGEQAYPEFRQRGSKWFNDDTYLFTCSMDGITTFNAGVPTDEGKLAREFTDIQGRPFVKMMLEASSSPMGEGWVHYQYPKPGGMFPAWKSSYVKRVTFPSGKEHLVGCGIYNMQLDEPIIEDMVTRAAALIAEHGKLAFVQLRDKTGPFYFMNTYVFVMSPDGIELVNPAMPTLEGNNILNLKDLQGREVIREEIAAATSEGSAWLEQHWYMPGDNIPALKHTFVRKVEHDGEAFIVGSGYYVGKDQTIGAKKKPIQLTSWKTVEPERLNDKLSRQVILGEKATLTKLTAKSGAVAARHFHPNEEYLLVVSGSVRYVFDDGELVARVGDVVVVPPNVPHAIVAREDSEFIYFFVPVREDWLKGEDLYLRSQGNTRSTGLIE